MKIGRFIGNAASRLPIVGRVIDRGRASLRQNRASRRGGRYRNCARRHRVFRDWLGRSASITSDQWLAGRMPESSSITAFPVQNDRCRLTVVTDSVGISSLFGGVGTSLILGALLAERMGATLRLVTRLEHPDAGAVRSVLKANGLAVQIPIETAFVRPHGGRGLAVGDRDYFMSTSWWSTRALLPSVRRNRLFYLLQEDERMFYPHGDTRLACALTLAEPDIFTVINTQLLYQHLVAGPDPLPSLEQRSAWFEPAFPGINSIRETTDGRKRRLFFYARPSNPRNLFDTGLAALANAISAGLFPASEWELHFVGKDIPNVTMPRGIRPIIHQGLSWAAYQSLIATMDAGFVLMDTPHPSYPPLDLASYGAAVLTTKHGMKTDLSRYSHNILMVAPEPAAMAAGLERLVQLAGDDNARSAHRVADGICRDWRETLSPVLDRIVAYFSNEQAVRSVA